MRNPGRSPFSVRGVIEGFYGRPWTHAQRLDLVSFIAPRGMNTFVYAPKDDPLVRRGWRVPYAGRDLKRLSELAAACRRNDVELVYCLSPGLSIHYASEQDLEALCAKFESVAELGVRAFGLLLDDIPEMLQHEGDREAFPDLVDAQVSLVSRLFERLGPNRSLIVCPTLYWGYGDEQYIARFGRGIDPRIDLFWTGRAICSPTLDLFDAATFARATGRPPTYWDNYPVNDAAMSHELHIGPYRGRDRHLWRFATGVIANGMELFESSKIAFATIADYLASPENYDPEASWQAALRDVVGEADLDAFVLFADNVRSSALCADDAPIVSGALATFTFEREHGEGQAVASRDLAQLANRLLAAADHLLRGAVWNPALIAEARPWIEAFEIGAQALGCMAQLGEADRLEVDGRAELLPYLQRLRDARVRVFGDVVDMTLTDLTAAPDTESGTVAQRGSNR
jgi:hyaluronoglucosaminidase